MGPKRVYRGSLKYGSCSASALEITPNMASEDFSKKYSSTSAIRKSSIKRMSLQNILGYSQKLYDQNPNRLGGVSEVDSDLDLDSRSIASEMSFWCRGEISQPPTPDEYERENPFEDSLDHRSCNQGSSQSSRKSGQFFLGHPFQLSESPNEYSISAEEAGSEGLRYEGWASPMSASYESIGSLTRAGVQPSRMSFDSLESESSSSDVVEPELSEPKLTPRIDTSLEEEETLSQTSSHLAPSNLLEQGPRSRPSSALGRAIKKALGKLH